MQATIWTIGYNPWVMGGTTHYVAQTTLECEGPFDLGKGYLGYRATSPDGKIVIAEALSGAIVGHDLEQVRQDIAAGEEEIMRQQVDDAFKTYETMRRETLTPEGFWRKMKAH